MTVLICPLASPGYLYPAVAVGRQLLRDGQDVAVLTSAALAPRVAGAGLPVCTAGEFGFADAALWVGRWHRTDAVLDQTRLIDRASAALGADRLLTSVLNLGALLSAARTDRPVAVLGLMCHLWPLGTPTNDPDAQWRHDATLRFYAAARDELGDHVRNPSPERSPLLGEEFMVRGHTSLRAGPLPSGVRDVGPCWWEPPTAAADVDRLDGWLAAGHGPVLYVHLGRTFGAQHELLAWAVRLAAAGRARIVVEVGRSQLPVPELPGVLGLHAPVMDYAVRRCDAVATSATTAPVLAALRHGKTLIVSPAGSEQPSLAAALTTAGVASAAADIRDTVELEAALADRGLGRRAAEICGRLLRLGGTAEAAMRVRSLGRPAGARELVGRVA